MNTTIDTIQDPSMDPNLALALQRYDSVGAVRGSEPIDVALINDTYRVRTEGGNYIAQKINRFVFRDIEGLMDNYTRVSDHIAKKARARGVPEECIMQVIRTSTDNSFVEVGEDGEPEAWRLLTEVADGQSPEKVENYDQAYVVARTFGQFTGDLDDFPAEELNETIPDFHNTPKYYDKLVKAKENSAVVDPEADELYERFAAQRSGYGVIMEGLASGEIPTRVAHNDTKANNAYVYIDPENPANNTPITALDRDTVMPGSVLFDFGDGARSACNNGEEDDVDLDNVYLRQDLFAGWVAGYFRGMRDRGVSFSDSEIDHMVDSVKLIADELSMRFLTDYYNGNVYFKTDPERAKHNLERAKAQFKLAQYIEDHREELQAIVDQERQSAA